MTNKERIKKFRERHPGYDKKYSKGLTQRRKDNRIKLIEEHGGKCIRCGYNRCVEVLEFHHRDPATKLFKLHNHSMMKPWNDLIDEASKCDLLCANCHREIHHTENAFPVQIS